MRQIYAITKRASNYMFGTTKVEGIAFDATQNEELYEVIGTINVSRREARRKNIQVLFAIDFKELSKNGVKIEREDRLTPFDKAVHNAVATLWVAGHQEGKNFNEYLTPRIIFQILSGNTNESREIGPEIRKAILRSIDKMRNTEISIDNSEEAQKFGYEKFNYKSSLLPSERIEGVRINGNEVLDCIHILRKPPLFDYADIKNQVGSVDIKTLKVPIKNTCENIELKEYLLMRILSIKNSKSNLSPTIRYSTVYEYLRIHAATPKALTKKKEKVRKNIITLLNAWISTGFITSYAEDKEGRTKAKVTIKV